MRFPFLTLLILLGIITVTLAEGCTEDDFVLHADGQEVFRVTQTGTAKSESVEIQKAFLKHNKASFSVEAISTPQTDGYLSDFTVITGSNDQSWLCYSGGDDRFPEQYVLKVSYCANRDCSNTTTTVVTGHQWADFYCQMTLVNDIPVLLYRKVNRLAARIVVGSDINYYTMACRNQDCTDLSSESLVINYPSTDQYEVEIRTQKSDLSAVNRAVVSVRHSDTIQFFACRDYDCSGFDQRDALITSEMIDFPVFVDYSLGTTEYAFMAYQYNESHMATYLCPNKDCVVVLRARGEPISSELFSLSSVFPDKTPIPLMFLRNGPNVALFYINQDTSQTEIRICIIDSPSSLPTLNCSSSVGQTIILGSYAAIMDGPTPRIQFTWSNNPLTKYLSVVYISDDADSLGYFRLYQ